MNQSEQQKYPEYYSTITQNSCSYIDKIMKYFIKQGNYDRSDVKYYHLYNTFGHYLQTVLCIIKYR